MDSRFLSICTSPPQLLSLVLMESWLHSLGFACCSRSKTPPAKQREEPVVLEQQPKQDDLHSLPTLQYAQEKLPLEETSDENETPVLRHDWRVDGRRVALKPQLSKTSTLRASAAPGAAINTANLILSTVYAGQMICTRCEEPATGFCVGCPTKRYCFQCYETMHASKSPGVHRFSSYSTGPVRPHLRTHRKKGE